MLMLFVLPVGSDQSHLAPALDILALISKRLTAGVLLSELVVFFAVSKYMFTPLEGEEISAKCFSNFPTSCVMS